VPAYVFELTDHALHVCMCVCVCVYTVDFVPAYVFELVDRPGRPLIGAEEFIEGVFQKHNNNVGGTITGVCVCVCVCALNWHRKVY